MKSTPSNLILNNANSFRYMVEKAASLHIEIYAFLFQIILEHCLKDNDTDMDTAKIKKTPL